MRKVIFYSPHLVALNDEGTPHATLDDIRATARALSKSSGVSHVLRDVTVFTGNLEMLGEDYPEAVLLLVGLTADEADVVANDTPEHIRDAFKRVGQAFAEVEVEVSVIGLHGPEAESEEADGEADDATAALNALKARATELGINFNPNIGADTLAKRIAVEEDAKAKEEAQ